MSIFQTTARVLTSLVLIQESSDAILNSEKHLERLQNISFVDEKLDSEDKKKIVLLLSKVMGVLTIFSSISLVFGKLARLNAVFLSFVSFMNVVLKNPFWVEKTSALKFASIKNLIYDSTLFSSVLLLTTHGLPNYKWRKYYSNKVKALKVTNTTK